MSPPRRGFLKRFSAGVIGAVVGIVPLLSGIAVLFDPLRRKAAQGEPVDGPVAAFFCSLGLFSAAGDEKPSWAEVLFGTAAFASP